MLLASNGFAILQIGVLTRTPTQAKTTKSGLICLYASIRIFHEHKNEL